MKVILLISVWLVAVTTYSQENPEDAIDPERLTDDLLSYQDEDINYEDLYENLAQILSSPFDLNTVSAGELKQLHILSDVQVNNLISYREGQGKILDIHELQVIPGFHSEVISRLLPFVKVIDPLTRIDKSLLKRMFSPGNSYLIMRYEQTLEQKKGFKASPDTPAAFTGSPEKTYFRFRSSMSGDFSIGVTGEKDAGEKMKFEPGRHQWGFDFTSFHLQLQNKGKLKNLIVGDFQSQFGQGLMFGGAFGLGKGGESISTTRKSNVGFQPYTSIHESAYQRGLAFTIYPVKHIGISAFYSSARRDASTENEGDSLTLTAFQTTGYHRTESELIKRKMVTEQNAGMVIHLEKGNVEGGLMINGISFSVPVQRNPTLYNQFAFRGSTNVNTGFYFNWRSGNIAFFSEGARSFPGGTGVVSGLLINAHPNLEVAILYRTYARNFHTFYANAFSENTQPQNERGIYWGWRYRWNRRYSLNGYVDLFSFPWLGFRRYSLSGGYEWLIRGNYQPSKNVSLVIHFREESKDSNLSGATNLYMTGERIRRNVSLRCNLDAGKNIGLKSLIQYNAQDFDAGTTEGWALIQDISFSLGKFRFTGRHGLFDTDHYDNRQYVYESDAWSSYSFPAYSGSGVRNYALIEYKVNKQLTIWFRYACTRMTTGGEIGSGQETIEGNTKNDVKFQARFRF